jgi:hypothetical protein
MWLTWQGTEKHRVVHLICDLVVKVSAPRLIYWLSFGRGQDTSQGQPIRVHVAWSYGDPSAPPGKIQRSRAALRISRSQTELSLRKILRECWHDHGLPLVVGKNRNRFGEHILSGASRLGDLWRVAVENGAATGSMTHALLNPYSIIPMEAVGSLSTEAGTRQGVVSRGPALSTQLSTRGEGPCFRCVFPLLRR